MTNSKSLSSDMDFIKEFEELKIKQKLLVETLNKKRAGVQNDNLININSKLDFLVNLFKDANKSSDDVDPHQEIMTAFENLSKRIDSIEENFTNKLSELETSISNSPNQTPQKTTKKIELEYDDIETKLNPHKETIKPASKIVAPTPDFSVKDNLVESKIEGITIPKEEKKKRKWF